MINKKKIFLMSSVSIVAASSIIAVAAACTEEQKSEQKSNQTNQKQSDTKSGSGSSVIRNNSSKNSIKFAVTLQSDTLSYNNQKHSLALNVGSQYARKVVEVELKPNSSSLNRSSIKSTKVASDTKGNTTVEFSGLEHNKSYYVSAVNVYEDLRKTTPIVSNSYFANTTETLVVKTPANGDGSNNVDSSNGSSNPNNGFSPNPGFNNPNPGFGSGSEPDISALLEHIKKQNELRQKLASRRPTSKEVKELKIKENEAYEKIKNRSFAIGFNSVDFADEGNNQKNSSIVPFEPTGTGWLLDYAWKKGEQNSDELMLYMATNAHVYSRAFNAMKNGEAYKKQFPEYFTQDAQKDARIDSFILAVPKKEASLEAIPSGTSYDSKNDLHYFVNTQNNRTIFSSDNATKQITYDDTKIFENPRTVFVALNIFDKENNDKLVDKANNNAQRKYSGKDFAVFALKVKYKALEEKAKTDEKYRLLLDHIKAAMKSIDDDITKFSSKKHPNHDQGSLPYLSIDHPSMWIDEQKPDSEKLDKNAYKIDDTTSLNVERAYIAGFPTIGRKQMLWRNYPKNSDIPQDAFTGTSFTIGQPLKSVLDANSNASGFGFNAFVDYSSIYFGASGSLVVNEYGLPIGIYSSVSTKIINETDISKNGGFTYLVQVHNDNEKGPAHNLIDGTDSSKFLPQKKSYRQNLKWLSEQSDSEFKDFAKTAIFKYGA